MAASSTKKVRLLLTCIGRRVELLRAFELAGKRLGLDLELHGADVSRTAPAMHVVPHTHVVPSIASGRYVDALLEIVQDRKIDLLIPLIDSELQTIADAAPRFVEYGCTALISSAALVRICRDKLAAHDVLREFGIDTPATWAWKQAMERKTHRFPYYLKPRSGSAAAGNYIVKDIDELRVLGNRVPDGIVQEFVHGIEHTLDVYTGFDGIPRCVVPRRRLEVRSGEVSKSLIVKDARLMKLGRVVADLLEGFRGVITVQCIVDSRKRVRVIEINPRFGGGVPLSIHAGADFPRWILAEFVGRRPRVSDAAVRDGMAMLRFDDSVFVRDGARISRDENLGRRTPIKSRQPQR